MQKTFMESAPGVNIIKLLSSSLTLGILLEVSAPGKPLQPSLMSWGKARSLS